MPCRGHLRNSRTPFNAAPGPNHRLRTGTRNQAKFLAAYSVYGMVNKASKLAGIELGRHAQWMKLDPTYPARFEEARATALQAMEDDMTLRARHGLRKPVLHQGKHVVTFEDGIRKPLYEYEYSDQLLMFALKAMAPHKV